MKIKKIKSKYLVTLGLIGVINLATACSQREESNLELGGGQLKL